MRERGIRERDFFATEGKENILRNAAFSCFLLQELLIVLHKEKNLQGGFQGNMTLKENLHTENLHTSHWRFSFNAIWLHVSYVNDFTRFLTITKAWWEAMAQHRWWALKWEASKWLQYPRSMTTYSGSRRGTNTSAVSKLLSLTWSFDSKPKNSNRVQYSGNKTSPL